MLATRPQLTPAIAKCLPNDAAPTSTGSAVNRASARGGHQNSGLGASGTQSRWLLTVGGPALEPAPDASSSPLERWFWGETRLEAARALTTLQGIGCGSRRQDAKRDELRTEFVADVHRLGGCAFEVQPHLRDGVIGRAAHAGSRELVVGAFAVGRGSLLFRPRR